MAYIGHRCGCGHSDLQHSGEGPAGTCQAASGASCGRGCTPSPDPEVIPTFDTKGQPIERLIPPGEGLASMSGAPIVRTCSCDACAALHEQLTSVAA
ncbi:hypothetical protein [Streptomyces sp. NPDC002994]|uniref:hypothetical protein n=1 Tax=Streptomyces sp. NPDC002994 TaxID=3154441 RepID=UPI0033BB09D2